MSTLTQENIATAKPSRLFYSHATGYVILTQDTPQRKLATRDHDIVAELIAAHDMQLVVNIGTPHFRPICLLEPELEYGYDYVNRNDKETPAEQIEWRSLSEEDRE